MREPSEVQDDVGSVTHKPKTGHDPHAAWISGTVALSHGTRIRMTYRKHKHEGHICDGMWRVKGRDFNSPSLAANHVARTRAHKKTRLNGWVYWEAYFRADHKWVPIINLRG